MPLQVTLVRAPDSPAPHPDSSLNNIGLGGLAFSASQPLSPGQAVSVSFPLLSSQQALSGLVVWSAPRGERFEIGVQFNDPNELYCLRMIEQICHIEHYRREVAASEDRQLTSEQAAREWIARYARHFPGFDND